MNHSSSNSEEDNTRPLKEKQKRGNRKTSLFSRLIRLLLRATLLVLLIGLLAFIVALNNSYHIAQYLLSQQFQRPVTIGDLRIDVLGHITATDILIPNPSWAEEENWISVDKLSGFFDVRRLFQGTVNFYRLRLEGVRFFLQVREDGTTNIPRATHDAEDLSEGPTLEEIMKLLKASGVGIDRGSFRMLIPDKEIELTVDSITLRGTRRPGDEPKYLASLSLEKARFTLGDKLDVTASLTGENIEVDTRGARLTDKELVLTAGDGTTFRSNKGSLDNFAYPFLKFDVTSNVSLDDIRNSLFIPTDLKGTLRLEGQLVGLADDLFVKASLLNTTPLQAHQLYIDKILSGVLYKDGIVYLQNITARMYNGSVSADGWLHFLDEPRFSLSGHSKKMDVGDVLAAFDVRQPITGRVSADFSLTGDGFEEDLISGSIKLSSSLSWKNTVAGQRDPTTSLVVENNTEVPETEHVNASLSLRNRTITVHKFEGYVARTHFKTKGSLTFDGGMTLTTEVDSRDCAELATLIELFIAPPQSTKKQLTPLMPRPVLTTSPSARLKKPGRERIVQTPAVTRPGRTSIPDTPSAPTTLSSLVTGQLSILATVTGTFDRPRVDAEFVLSQATLFGIACQHLSTRISVSPETISIERFTASMEQMEANISGFVDRAGLSRIQEWFGKIDTITLADMQDLKGKLPEFRIKASITAFDLHYISEQFPDAPSMTGKGDLAIDIERSATLKGTGSVLVRNLTVGDEELFLASLAMSVDDEMLRVDTMSLIFFEPNRNHAEISGRGELGFDGSYSFDVRTDSFDSHLIGYLQEFEPSLSGIVVGYVRGDGTLTEPHFEGKLSLFDLQFEQSKLGMGSLSFTSEAAVLHGELSLHEQNVMATFTYDMANSRIDRGEIKLTDSNFLPALSLLGLDNVSDLVGRATGDIHLEGSLLDLADLSVTASLPSLVFGLESYPLTNTSDIQATLSGGILTVPPMTLTGTLSSIYLSGAIDISHRSLIMGAEGQVDLTLLKLIEPQIKYSAGTATFGAHLEGPFDSPYLSVETFISDGELILTAVPVEIDRISAMLSLKNRQLVVHSFQGYIGAGTISAEGNAYIPELDDAFDPLQTMLDIAVEARSIELDYPDGFYGIVSSKLDVSNSIERPFLSGQVIINSGDLEQQINIRSLLIETIRDVFRSRPAIFIPPSGIGFNPGFNITIENEQPMKLISDDVVATFDLDLYLSGNLSDPKLLGAIVISEGEVYFDASILSLSNSTISFLNPKGIYPSLDLVGESTIQRYNVQVTVSGEYPDILISFNSDEGLTKNEVLSLILFGELDMSGGQVGKTESLRFASDIFLENEILSKVKQLFSISRFQVAPIWITEGGSSNVRMQMTVGAEIIGGYLTYTRTAESTDYDIITMEWELSRRLVIGFIRDKDRSYGGDIRFKFPFP